MPDLLLELRSEEIPARMQRKAAGDLKKLLTDALVEAGLTYEGAREYWTPRRLTLDIRGLTAHSAELREEKKGPSVTAPQQAIDGFLRGAGLTSIDQTETRTDPKKGDFYVAIITKPGRSAEAIIADVMPGIIRNFPWPKSMRSGVASAKPGALRWVRPLQSIVCMWGTEHDETTVIPFEVDGIVASNITYGHRFHAPGAITVRRFSDYVSSLEKAKVVLDAERRKEIILSDAKNIAFASGLDLVEDEALLEEVSGLVEFPHVLMGTFEEDYLKIPAEIIRLTIKTNQKCFVTRKQGTDELSNRFILVANIEAKDDGREIVHGNGKVVRARLSDAAHFYKRDQADMPDLHELAASAAKFGLDLKKPLDQRMAKLDHLNVTFHAKLGTQGARVERIRKLAEELAPIVFASMKTSSSQHAMGASRTPSSGPSDHLLPAGEKRELDAGPATSSPQRGEGGAHAPDEGAFLANVDRAAVLAKADLRTEAVGEFPELQGLMGRRYALLQGEDASVAAAIEEHWKPNGPSDRVPTDPVSVTIALADKLDTLTGFWIIDEKPTGSKDPYALRRAALGVIRILLENGIRLSLRDIMMPAYMQHLYSQQVGNINVYLVVRELGKPEYSFATVSFDFLDFREGIAPKFPFDYNDKIYKVKSKKDGDTHYSASHTVTLKDEDVVSEHPPVNFLRFDLLSFFHDRLKVYLRDTGKRHDIVDAVLTEDADDLLTITRKAEALAKFIDTEDGRNLLAGTKRATQLLAAEEKKGTRIADRIDLQLLTLPAEKRLHAAIVNASQDAASAVAHEDFGAAMEALSRLRGPVDTFFNDVLVNDENADIRANRLALLSAIRAATATVADFSKISG